MAEFCLECWNRLNETTYDEKKYVISKDLDLCEGCGEWKPVIIMERRAYYIRKFRFFLPIKIIYHIIYFFWRLFLLPYVVFCYIKSKNK